MRFVGFTLQDGSTVKINAGKVLAVSEDTKNTTDIWLEMSSEDGFFRVDGSLDNVLFKLYTKHI